MLVQADASQLEWRTLLWMSQDQVGIREVLEGQDIHGNNQKELQLPERLIAKIFLFRCIYRGSGWAYAHDNMFKHVSEDPKFWDAKNDAFYKKYSGINRLHNLWRVKVQLRKPIQIFSGREWMIPLKEDGSIPWTVLTNWPNQGLAADCMAIARVSFRNRIVQSGLSSNIKLVNTVHDSIVVDCPDELTTTASTLLLKVFGDLPKNFQKLWGVEPPIPFPAEIKIGHNMRDMEKVKL